MWVKSGSNLDSIRVTPFTCARWPQIWKWLEPYSWVWVESGLKMPDREAKWRVDKRGRFGQGRWYKCVFPCLAVLFDCSCTNNVVGTRHHCGRQSPQSISANAYTISRQRATQRFLVCHIRMSALQLQPAASMSSLVNAIFYIQTSSRLSKWKPSSTHFHLHHI